MHDDPTARDDGGFEFTERGSRLLEGMGVDHASARGRRRAFAPECLDWTERRSHLAGALGAALAEWLLDLGWVRRRPESRAVTVSPTGESGLRVLLGIGPR